MDNINDLYSEVKKLKKEILILKIKQSYDNFSNTSEFKKNRRKVARLLTKVNHIKKQEKPSKLMTNINLIKEQAIAQIKKIVS